MRLRINRVAHPVTVLGPGRRVGLWTQGCHLACPGCASSDTWDANLGHLVEVADLAIQLGALMAEHHYTGLTITGGEPLEQVRPLTELVARVRRRVEDAIDVLMFTGYAATAAKRAADELWDELDLVVAGPYRRDRPSHSPLLASSNQRLLTLTPLGAKRLAEAPAVSPALQPSVDDTDITLIGLPPPGALDELAGALAERGVRLEKTSWTH